MTILEIHSYGVMYGKIRDDPVFPAKEWNRERQNFQNNETWPRELGCADTASICDPDMNSCWSFPEFGKFNYSLTPIPIWTRTPKSFGSIGTDAELARALLYTAIFNNFLEPYYDRYSLEAESHCRYSRCSLPRNQWEVEARQLFETSLAKMQFNVLDIVRGTDNKREEDFYGIPPEFRGMCKMGKFKSIGWQNVSFWGLFGLLFFAGAISLASIQTEKGEFWLVIGVVLIYRALLWVIDQLRAVSRASMLRFRSWSCGMSDLLRFTQSSGT